MYNIKGFLSVGALSNNAPNQIAPFGELSTHSLTYARDKGIFVKHDKPDVVFYSFSSRNDSGDTAVTAAFSNHIIDFGQWLFAFCAMGGFTNDAAEAVRNIRNNNAQVDDLEIGNMLNKGGTNFWMPEWVSWKYLSGGVENRIKVWLSDNSFQNQYDGFQIIVVPPVASVDDFFDDRTHVSAALAVNNPAVLMEKINTTANENPYTYLRAEAFEWVEQGVANSILPTYWTLLIYGEAGNNIDNIKDELIKYILANSNYTREQWTEVFPDLFKATECIITPLWDQYSIPNKTLEAGVYSPTVDYQRALEVAKLTAPDYPAAHVEAVLSVASVNYKSLAMTVVGGPDNRGGLDTFKELMPDYMNVPTTNMDFDRMSRVTQDWVMLLIRMLIAAETMTESTSVPTGLTRMKRNGVLYVVSNFNRVQYLVVTKSQFEIINAPEVDPLLLVSSDGDGLTNNTGDGLTA